MALADNRRKGIPVRVFRGRHHIPSMPPQYKYRYDGLYNITRYWSETGKHRYKVWRYRLEKLEDEGGSYDIDAASVPERPIPSGEQNPQRKEGRITRILRSTEVADHVKDLYEYTCQACEVKLNTPAGPYAEGCHIKPLGRPHNGPDVISNVLCLCPNCHVLFDEGAIWLDDDLQVMPVGKKLKQVASHNLDMACIRYHRGLRGMS